MILALLPARLPFSRIDFVDSAIARRLFDHRCSSATLFWTIPEQPAGALTVSFCSNLHFSKVRIISSRNIE
jgi:hypothetical protein